MFQIRHIVCAIVAVLCAALIAPQSQAQILQDILSRVTAARNNAATARDRAQEVRDEMRDASEKLTTDMRSFINDWIQEGERIIAEQRAGRDAWANGAGCGAFRQDLVAMLQSMQTIFNQLNLIADPNATPISFSDEIQLINQIDCKVLYALYLAMSASNAFGEHMVNLLQEGAAALEIIGGVMVARYQDVPGTTLDYELGQTVNQIIINNPTLIDDSAHVIKGLASVLKIVGKRLNAKAKSGVDTVEIEIWGWVGVTLKADEKSKWGEYLVGLSELLNKVEESVSDKMDHAMLIGSLAEIRDNQIEILMNQALILELLQNK